VTDALAKYGRSFSVGLRSAMVYRINFLFSLITAISPVLIQTALWTSIYGPDGAGTLFGFNYPQMIAYVVISNLVSRLVRTGFEYELNNDIRTGSLDRFLVKPIGYFGFRLAVFLGDKAVQSVLYGALLAATVWVLASVLGVGVTPSTPPASSRPSPSTSSSSGAWAWSASGSRRSGSSSRRSASSSSRPAGASSPCQFSAPRGSAP
jgi:ABC-type uncharacterized transport system permease subunit